MSLYFKYKKVINKHRVYHTLFMFNNAKHSLTNKRKIKNEFTTVEQKLKFLPLILTPKLRQHQSLIVTGQH
uniref:Uncharacterized protein n=1 Tax=Arion vulgaris TaxID=1028688 RepID=A0A0B7BEZ9_9EUPU